MQKSLIKLAYQQIIDINSQSHFEKDVFNDTYSELLMQVQAYNADNQFSTFQEVLANVPKAISLHYKVGFAIGLYVKELNNQIPYLTDSLQKFYLPFESHQFEILESNFVSKADHKVTITYKTSTLTCMGSISEYLLLALGNKSELLKNEGIETFMVKMQENLSICSFQEI